MWTIKYNWKSCGVSPTLHNTSNLLVYFSCANIPLARIIQHNTVSLPQTIEDNSFRYEEETQPAEYVETLAENMHLYPPEHYITGDRLYYKYDPKVRVICYYNWILISLLYNNCANPFLIQFSLSGYHGFASVAASGYG